jgi:hypothetical protein
LSLDELGHPSVQPCQLLGRHPISRGHRADDILAQYKSNRLFMCLFFVVTPFFR